MKLNSRDLVENHKVIDVNNLTELISSGGAKILEWTKRYGKNASIGIESNPSKDLLTLFYSYKENSIKEEIKIEYSSVNYGRRPNFVCPECGDRVRKLYLKNGRFRCRECHDLAYKSEQFNNKRDRELHKYKKNYMNIQKELGMDETGILEGLPENKPKDIRKDKFQRLKTRGNIIKHLFAKSFKKKYSKINKRYRDRLNELRS